MARPLAHAGRRRRHIFCRQAATRRLAIVQIMATLTKAAAEVQVAAEARCDLGESPVWEAQTGTLWFVVSPIGRCRLEEQ